MPCLRFTQKVVSCLLLLAALPSYFAFADGIGNSYSITAATYDIADGILSPTDQLTSGSLAAVVNAMSQAQGVDSFGRTYSVLSMAHADSGGLGLYASSSLTGGNTSASPVSTMAFAAAAMEFEFIVPTNVHFISLGLDENAHGYSTTGSSASAGGLFAEYLGDFSFTSSFAGCALNIDGSSQVKTCDPVAVTPGELLFFTMQAQLNANGKASGDSAFIDYLGTFTSNIDYYDANMNLIGQYDFPTPTSETPEPSSLILLGTGLIMAAVARRRL